MADRHGRSRLADACVAVAVAAVAAVVARYVDVAPSGRLPPLARQAPAWLGLIAYGCAIAQLATWVVGRWVSPDATAGALARVVAWLAMVLVAACRADSDRRADWAAAFAALNVIGLSLPAWPLPGGVLLDASLMRRLPQLVAARLAARIGVTAALLVPGLLLLATREWSDPPALVALSGAALALVAAARRSVANAFVLELELQARRGDSELSDDLRRELLARPPAPDLERRRPLAPEQFRAFRGACEAAYLRVVRRTPARAEA